MQRCTECFHYEACKDWSIDCFGANSIFPYEADENLCEYYKPTADVAPRNDVAREIFADLEARTPWFCENQTAYEHFIEVLAELKKKYTEGECANDGV